MKIGSNPQPPQPLPQETNIAKTGGLSVGRGGTSPVAPSPIVSPLVGSSPSSSPAGSSVFGGDRANLSSTAVSAAASSTLPEVRSEKITAIQQALANGSYAVSASDVAGKLIDHLLHN